MAMARRDAFAALWRSRDDSSADARRGDGRQRPRLLEEDSADRPLDRVLRVLVLKAAAAAVRGRHEGAHRLRVLPAAVSEERDTASLVAHAHAIVAHVRVVARIALLCPALVRLRLDVAVALVRQRVHLRHVARTARVRVAPPRRAAPLGGGGRSRHSLWRGVLRRRRSNGVPAISTAGRGQPGGGGDGGEALGGGGADGVQPGQGELADAEHVWSRGGVDDEHPVEEPEEHLCGGVCAEARRRDVRAARREDEQRRREAEVRLPLRVVHAPVAARPFVHVCELPRVEACGGGEQRDAERPDVRLGDAARLAQRRAAGVAHDLGAHVRRRAARTRRHRHVHETQAEVDELGAARREAHVGGLDIEVRHSARVGVEEPDHDVREDPPERRLVSGCSAIDDKPPIRGGVGGVAHRLGHQIVPRHALHDRSLRKEELWHAGRQVLAGAVVEPAERRLLRVAHARAVRVGVIRLHFDSNALSGGPQPTEED
mmetsp:Transcript_46374/g.149503  ORF Transcript_46374/g.149503 Transcript_46374/m.149503 type:complete len:487 (+) Transcript_46374:136-1596(+)